jgi:hypothetical protein
MASGLLCVAFLTHAVSTHAPTPPLHHLLAAYTTLQAVALASAAGLYAAMPTPADRRDAESVELSTELEAVAALSPAESAGGSQRDRATQKSNLQ